MIAQMIAGCTRVCGKAQGYLELPVRDIPYPLQDGALAPAMQTSWEPTPKELAALNSGGSVIITILGTEPPPMIVTAEKEAQTPCL